MPFKTTPSKEWSSSRSLRSQSVASVLAATSGATPRWLFHLTASLDCGTPSKRVGLEGLLLAWPGASAHIPGADRRRARFGDLAMEQPAFQINLHIAVGLLADFYFLAGVSLVARQRR